MDDQLERVDSYAKNNNWLDLGFYREPATQLYRAGYLTPAGRVVVVSLSSGRLRAVRAVDFVPPSTATIMRLHDTEGRTVPPRHPDPELL